jgi:hypothetical protein
MSNPWRSRRRKRRREALGRAIFGGDSPRFGDASPRSMHDALGGEYGHLVDRCRSPPIRGAVSVGVARVTRVVGTLTRVRPPARPCRRLASASGTIASLVAPVSIDMRVRFADWTVWSYSRCDSSYEGVRLIVHLAGAVGSTERHASYVKGTLVSRRDRVISSVANGRLVATSARLG